MMDIFVHIPTVRCEMQNKQMFLKLENAPENVLETPSSPFSNTAITFIFPFTEFAKHPYSDPPSPKPWLGFWVNISHAFVNDHCS